MLNVIFLAVRVRTSATVGTKVKSLLSQFVPHKVDFRNSGGQMIFYKIEVKTVDFDCRPTRFLRKRSRWDSSSWDKVS